jgi:hypothetical protein
VPIDLASGLAIAPAAEIFSLQMGLSLAVAALGGVAGAALARTKRGASAS